MTDYDSMLKKRSKGILKQNQASVKLLSHEEIQNLAEELKVHQIELEMQNNELRKTQRKLEAAIARYSDLYDFAPVGYITVSENGFILEANLTSADMLGMERIFLIGKRLSRFIAKEDESRFYYYRKKLLETKTRQTFELKLIKKDGTSFYTGLEGKAMKDAKEDFLSIRITIMDITDRKKADDKLREAYAELGHRVETRTAELMNANERLTIEIAERKLAEEKLIDAEFKYRTVADFAYDWEYWTNLDETVRYVSPSCERISGYEPEQFMKDPSLFKEIILAEDRPVWQQHLLDSRNEFKPCEIQFRIRRPDGEIRWIEHACQPVRNLQDEITGFRASNRDTTMRRQMELEIRQNREDLAHLERVAQLGEISAALAHELNQPLTAILSNAQAAKRFLDGGSPDLDEFRDILNDIIDEDKRAGYIIKRLLLLMKKNEIHPGPLSLNEIIEESVTLMHSDIINMKTSISMNLLKNPPRVTADKIHLQQVILNLIKNATDATLEKEPASGIS